MTRGKYATRADAQAALKAVSDDRDAQRAAIARLTAEKKRVQEELNRVKAANALERRKLLAQINEGTSDALVATKILLDEERERAANYKRALETETNKVWMGVRYLIDHVKTTYGVSEVEVWSTLTDDKAGSVQYLKSLNAQKQAMMASRTRNGKTRASLIG